MLRHRFLSSPARPGAVCLPPASTTELSKEGTRAAVPLLGDQALRDQASFHKAFSLIQFSCSLKKKIINLQIAPQTNWHGILPMEMHADGNEPWATAEPGSSWSMPGVLVELCAALEAGDSPRQHAQPSLSPTAPMAAGWYTATQASQGVRSSGFCFSKVAFHRGLSLTGSRKPLDLMIRFL